MRDVVFVSILVGFFALALAYVSACGWIVGADEPALATGDDIDGPGGPGDELDEVAA